MAKNAKTHADETLQTEAPTQEGADSWESLTAKLDEITAKLRQAREKAEKVLEAKGAGKSG